MARGSLAKTYDQQGMKNKTFDRTLKVEKVMLYGWDGSNPVEVKVDSNGKLIIA